MQIQWSPCGREGGWGPPLGSCGSRPVGALRGLARVHIQGLQAVLAAHSTAPVELTLALGHPGDAGGVIASPTAHDFAAVHASGSQVAHTACCTWGAWKTSQGVSLKWCGWNTVCFERKRHVVILQDGALMPPHHIPGLCHQFCGPPEHPGGNSSEHPVQEEWT